MTLAKDACIFLKMRHRLTIHVFLFRAGFPLWARLKIIIQILFGGELWVIGGQVKNLDFFGVLGQPGFDHLDMVKPQIFQK